MISVIIYSYNIETQPFRKSNLEHEQESYTKKRHFVMKIKFNLVAQLLKHRINIFPPTFHYTSAEASQLVSHLHLLRKSCMYCVFSNQKRIHEFLTDQLPVITSFASSFKYIDSSRPLLSKPSYRIIDWFLRQSTTRRQ